MHEFLPPFRRSRTATIQCQDHAIPSSLEGVIQGHSAGSTVLYIALKMVEALEPAVHLQHPRTFPPSRGMGDCLHAKAQSFVSSGG